MATGADFRSFQSPGTLEHSNDGGLLASSATMAAPLGYINRVSGTAALALIPLPYAGFQGTIMFIPTGAWTCVTTGTSGATNKAIAGTFTATANKPVFFTYVRATDLWYPSNV